MVTDFVPDHSLQWSGIKSVTILRIGHVEMVTDLNPDHFLKWSGFKSVTISKNWSGIKTVTIFTSCYGLGHRKGP